MILSGKYLINKSETNFSIAITERQKIYLFILPCWEETLNPEVGKSKINYSHWMYLIPCFMYIIADTCSTRYQREGIKRRHARESLRANIGFSCSRARLSSFSHSECRFKASQKFYLFLYPSHSSSFLFFSPTRQSCGIEISRELGPAGIQTSTGR